MKRLDKSQRNGFSEVDRIIVFGAPRSGTTYLMRVLNTLPDSECLIGTLMSSSIPQIASQDLPDDVYDALTVSFERSLDAYLHSGRYMSRAAALQKWANAPSGLSGLFQSLKKERSPNRLIYKEPFLSFAPEFVGDALPSARIIYIFRDGRDVANSLVKSYGVLTDDSLLDLKSAEMRLGRRVGERYVPWWIGEEEQNRFLDASPYCRAIWMWRFMVLRCQAYFDRPDVRDSGRVLRIRYEQFMKEPVPTGQALLDHIGAGGTKSFDRMLNRAHARSIGNYRRRDPNELREAEQIASDALDMLGYDSGSTRARVG